MGDEEREIESYQEVVRTRAKSFMRDAVGRLGHLLEMRGDNTRAIDFYRHVVEDGLGDVAHSASRLGYLLEMESDIEGAEEAYCLAIELDDGDICMKSAVALGDMLHRERRHLDRATTALSLVANSEHELASRSGLMLGQIMLEAGEDDKAARAFRSVWERSNPNYAPMAASNLGALLMGTDPRGAVQALRYAVRHGDATVARAARASLARMRA